MGKGKLVPCDKYPGQAGREETAVGRPFCACLRDLANDLGANSGSGETVKYASMSGKGPSSSV